MGCFIHHIYFYESISCHNVRYVSFIIFSSTSQFHAIMYGMFHSSYLVLRINFMPSVIFCCMCRISTKAELVPETEWTWKEIQVGKFHFVATSLACIQVHLLPIRISFVPWHTACKLLVHLPLWLFHQAIHHSPELSFHPMV